MAITLTYSLRVIFLLLLYFFICIFLSKPQYKQMVLTVNDLLSVNASLECVKGLHNPDKKDHICNLSHADQVTIFRLRCGHNRLRCHMFNCFKVGERQDVSVEQTNKTRSTSYKTASYTATNALPYGPQRCRSRKSSTAHAQTCG